MFESEFETGIRELFTCKTLRIKIEFCCCLDRSLCKPDDVQFILYGYTLYRLVELVTTPFVR